MKKLVLAGALMLLNVTGCQKHPVTSQPFHTSLTRKHLVKLSWSGKYSSSIVFRVYRSIGPKGSITLLAQTPYYSWIDTSVVSGVTYYYFVTAFDTKTRDESSASNFDHIKVP